jgi:hypothetical protein
VLEKKMRGEVTEMATSSAPKRQLRNLSRAPLIKLINPRFVLAVLPVIVFWLTHRVASTELAIGMGFAVSLLVFFTNRHRGAIGLLAILGITTVGGAAIIAIVIGSARAYLATDPIGDILAATIALASIFFQRPVSGVLGPRTCSRSSAVSRSTSPSVLSDHLAYSHRERAPRGFPSFPFTKAYGG